MQPHNLKAIFGKFAGQPLKDPNRLSADMDGVYAGMQDAAKKNGLELRVIFPGQNADFGFNPNRVTVVVDKDAKGKLSVGKISLG